VKARKGVALTGNGDAVLWKVSAEGTALWAVRGAARAGTPCQRLLWTARGS